jgi:hypothetical protein
MEAKKGHWEFKWGIDEWQKCTCPSIEEHLSDYSSSVSPQCYRFVPDQEEPKPTLESLDARLKALEAKLKGEEKN